MNGRLSLCNYIHQNSARKEKPFLVVDCSKKAKEVENEILANSMIGQYAQVKENPRMINVGDHAILGYEDQQNG